MNKTLKHMLTAVLFFLGLIALLCLCSLVLAPKENEKNIGLIPPVLYGVVHEPKNSVDVLILGNSESHTFMVPLRIWEDYGYTVLGCGSAGQPVSQSNMVLNFACNYQSPKIVIVETDMLYTHNSFYRAFLDQTQSFFTAFVTHNRWKSVHDERVDTLSDYTEITETKNYQYSTVTVPADASSYMTPSDESEPIPFVEEFYLKRIQTCCEKNGAKLVLVSGPSVLNWTMAKHNAVAQYAKENNVDFIDMNVLQNEIDLDWNTDTRDKGDHLNHAGALKVTAYIGKYLKETGLLKSHKADPAYASWHTLWEKFKTSTSQ